MHQLLVGTASSRPPSPGSVWRAAARLAAAAAATAAAVSSSEVLDRHQAAGVPGLRSHAAPGGPACQRGPQPAWQLHNSVGRPAGTGAGMARSFASGRSLSPPVSRCPSAATALAGQQVWHAVLAGSGLAAAALAAHPAGEPRALQCIASMRQRQRQRQPRVHAGRGPPHGVPPCGGLGEQRRCVWAAGGTREMLLARWRADVWAGCTRGGCRGRRCASAGVGGGRLLATAGRQWQPRTSPAPSSWCSRQQCRTWRWPAHQPPAAAFRA